MALVKVDLAHVRIDHNQLAQLTKGDGGPVFREVVERSERVRQRAKQLVGKRTHNLENSIVKRVVRGGISGFEVLVGVETSHVPYALIHHEGSRPHVILPRKGRYLVFTGRSGQTVFARRVNHPGTRPNPYLVRAAEQEGFQVRRLFMGS